jgi:hypothetical protein
VRLAVRCFENKKKLGERSPEISPLLSLACSTG